jgi:hypothetical protein
VPGDVLKSLPSGAELLILKSVIHDCHNERAMTVLSQCRAAASQRSRLLLMEP